MDYLFMNGRDDPEQRNERWVEIGIMEKYIDRIVVVCETAKPNAKMMFDDFGKYILHIEKNENYIVGTDIYNLIDVAIYEKDAIICDGKAKDLLVGDEIGIHVLDLYRVLKEIADGTRELSVL